MRWFCFKGTRVQLSQVAVQAKDWRVASNEVQVRRANVNSSAQPGAQRFGNS
jgi:hypothetical protein